MVVTGFCAVCMSEVPVNGNVIVQRRNVGLSRSVREFRCAGHPHGDSGVGVCPSCGKSVAVLLDTRGRRYLAEHATADRRRCEGSALLLEPEAE